MNTEPGERGSSHDVRVHSAALYCEVCGEDTVHRILHLDSERGPVVRGVARCRTCRTTHPFEAAPEARTPIFVIRSDGTESTRSQVSVPSGARLTVGERLPGAAPPVRIHKVDRSDGRSVREAEARRVRTVWVTPDEGAVVHVSLVEGRRTGSTRLVLPPDTILRVGEAIPVDGRRWYIVGLRARGHTWRRPDDAFPAREVDRVYTRRAAMPPAGSQDWSRSRATPISRESSTSRSARSRSGPGVRM